MNEENCEKAIETLNGLDIKGRTATVTYSKKK
jgi:RNA recognition motif-containing protein